MINKRKSSYRETHAHANWMGGPSYDISNPLHRLKLASSSCFFGEPQYYHRGGVVNKHINAGLSVSELNYLRDTLNAIDPVEWRNYTPTKMMETAIDEALAYDPAATLEWAGVLRNQEHMRVTPQVILVRAANTVAIKGTGLVRKFAPEIIKRADEPSTGLAYQLAVYGKPVPNALKKAWADALESFDDYALAKYRMESRQVKAVDVVNMVHPSSAAVNRLMRGELNQTDRTWEAIISKRGSTKEAWIAALDVMGHMALLRNLRNLIEKDVPQELYLNKLLDGVKYGKQFPFRYYSAFRAVQQIASPALLDTVEQAMLLSLDNLPTFRGRVMSLTDNSGSATHTTTSSMGAMAMSTIGNLTGVITGMQSDEGYVGVFGDRLAVMPVRKRSSIFDTLKEADRLGDGIGGGTENGIWLFWDKAIKEKEHWDTVFVYSDMQAGHGGLYGTQPQMYASYQWFRDRRYIDIPKLINTYRNQVNPEVNVFLVQIAGYQDTIIPEFYNKTYLLGGWSDSLLRFANSMLTTQ